MEVVTLLFIGLMLGFVFLLPIFIRLRKKWQHMVIDKDELQLAELAPKLQFKIYKKSPGIPTPSAYERLSASLQLAFRDGTSLRSLVEGDGWMCGIINSFGADGRDNQGGRPFTIFMRILNHPSPHLYFDNKQNGDAFRNELPAMLDNAELVNYESFVHDSFRLYAPKGYHIDSLVIAAPDVLDVISNENQGADIELLGNQLYLFFPFRADLSDNLEAWIMSSEKIATAVDDNLSRYRDSRQVSQYEPIGYSGKRLTKH